MFNINSKEDFLNKKIIISYQNKLEVKQIVKVLEDNFKDIVWRNGNKPTQLPLIVRHCDGYLLIIDKKLYLSDACETDKTLLLSFSQFNNLIVELNRKPILDEVEKKYLWNIVKPFKNRVVDIYKSTSYVDEYAFIVIRVKSIFKNRISYESLLLPMFKRDDMYKNMKGNKKYTLEELGLIEPKKFTLTEFWNNKGKKSLAIHCDTKEKATKLLKAFDKLGEKWNDGDSYLSLNMYGFYKDKTCYSNNGGYNRHGFYKARLYKIYEFDEVDLEN